MRRLLAATAVVAVAALNAPPVLPAGALPQPGIRVEADQTVEKEYQPIPVFNPSPATPATDPINPNDCKTSPACDTIPLEIVVPLTLDEADEFFVTVELSWQTMKTPGVDFGGPVGSVNETAVNDLDLYVWEDPQGADNIASSATSTSPEKLRMFRPVKGHYQIVVANYLGPNTGYKLTVTYKPERIETPFESLDPGFIPPLEPEVPITPPLDLSAEPEVAAAPLPVLPAPATEPAPPAPLAPAPVEPDADFAASPDSGLDEELAAPPESDVLKERQAAVTGPPKPASPSSLVFWLLAVPLVLVAGAGLWLAKRGSGVLRLR
jgi:hypothetical protein